MKRQLFTALGVLGLCAGTFAVTNTAQAADHLEAPAVQEDGRTDIGDLYAFRDGDNTVLIMTVNPAAGVLSPTTFDPDAQYRFQIDTDGDFKKDETISVKFRDRANGEQRVIVKGMDKGRGNTGETIELRSGGQAIAGTFDDPFFFDFEAFLGAVKGQGDRTFCDSGARDFFEGFNSSAIVLQIPTHELTNGSETINVWAETKTKSRGDLDRMGKPAIATVLIDDGNEDAFNDNSPRRDVRRYAEEVSANLQFLSGLDGDGYSEEEADGIAELLLPDVLTLDTTSDAGFTDGILNGRQLAEDVIDFELFVVTGGLSSDPVLTTDCVDANDVAFPGTFPYLAPAHS